MLNKCLPLLILLVFCASAFAQADRKLVKLRSGSELVGQVTETDDGYDITLASGATMSVGKDAVVSMTDYVAPADEYQQRLGKAEKANKANEWYRLGAWAYEQEMYQRSVDALEKALKLKPKHRRAGPLLRQVKAKLAAADKPEPKNGNGKTPENGKKISIRPEYLLDAGDIANIRREELREKDRVRISFKDDVVDRFVDAYRGRGDFEEAGFERQFRRASSLDKARYMLKILPAESTLRNDIIVKSDPKFMEEFRSTVWPMVRQNCATSTCHGGKKPHGGLLLFVGPRGNDKVDYTNFILMTGYVHRGRRLLDRSNPEKSLLLQHGLHRDHAQFRHPKKISPAFPNRRDRQYRAIEDWIRKLSYPPALPEYELDYTPPEGIKFSLESATGLFDEPETQPDEKKNGDEAETDRDGEEAPF